MSKSQVVGGFLRTTFGALLIVLAVLLATGAVRAQGGSSVLRVDAVKSGSGWLPPKVLPGTLLDVGLNPAAVGPEVSSIEATITYDPAKVELVTVPEGVSAQGEGRLRFTWAQGDGPDAPQPKVTVRVKAGVTGSIVFDFDAGQTAMSDAEGQALLATLEATTVTVAQNALVIRTNAREYPLALISGADGFRAVATPAEPSFGPMEEYTVQAFDLPAGPLTVWMVSPGFLMAEETVTQAPAGASEVNITLTPGDTNQDGTITPADIERLLPVLKSSAFLEADWNDNGVVDLADLARVAMGAGAHGAAPGEAGGARLELGPISGALHPVTVAVEGWISVPLPGGEVFTARGFSVPVTLQPGAPTPLEVGALLPGEWFFSYRYDGQARMTGGHIAAGQTPQFILPYTLPPVVIEVDPVPEMTTQNVVTITGKVSGAWRLRVSGAAGPVTIGPDGRFSANVAVELGVNSILVLATDYAGAAHTPAQPVVVTRVAGAAASIDAPESLNLQAGQAVDLPIAVKDANGNVVVGAPITLVVAGEVGTYDPGSGSFTAATHPATGTMVVQSGDLSRSIPVTVTPGPLAKLLVAPGEAYVGQGQIQQFTAKGADSYDNEVALPGPVTWSASGGVITGSGLFGGTTPGKVTVTATAGAVSGTAVAHVYGPAAKVILSAPAAPLVANGAAQTTIVAKVVDPMGTLVANYSGPIAFTSSDPNAVTVVTPSVSAVGGVATATLRAGTVNSSAVISASAAGLVPGTVEVTQQAPVLTSIDLRSNLNRITSGGTALLTAVLLDQTGVPLTSYPAGLEPIVLSLSSSDPGIAFVTPTVTLTAPTTQLTIQTGTAVGGATITGAVQAPAGLALPVAPVSVETVLAGLPYALRIEPLPPIQAGQHARVIVHIVDHAGNRVTTVQGAPEVTLSVSAPDGNHWQMAARAPAFGQVEFELPLSQAGAHTLAVTAAGQALRGHQAEVTVVPGPAARLGITALPATLAADGAMTATLKAEVLDNWGNKTREAVPVTFTKSEDGGATQPFVPTTVTSADGVATVTVRATLGEGTDTFSVTSPGLMMNFVRVSTQIMGVPQKLAVFSTPTGPAGTDVAVEVQVQDGNGVHATSDEGRPVTLTVKDGAATVATYTAPTEYGTARFTVALTAAKTYTLEVTAPGLTKGEGILVVNPGQPAALSLAADHAVLAAAPGSRATLTVAVLDAYGNRVPTGPAITLTSSNPMVATFDSGSSSITLTTPGPGGLFTTTDGMNSLHATPFVGSTTVTATAPGLAPASLEITTVMAGAPALLQVEPIAPVTVGSPQELKVSLTDAMGALLTDNSSSTVTLSVGSASVSVQVWSQAQQAWVPYTPGEPAPLYKGEVRFAVTNAQAETVTYTLTASDAAVAPQTVTGSFEEM